MTKAKELSELASAATVTSGNVALSGGLDVDGVTDLDVVDIDGAANFAADVTFANGADIITASAGTSNFRAGVNAGNSIESGGNYNTVVGDDAGTAITTSINNTAVGWQALTANTTGDSSTAVGLQALATATTSNSNSAFGTEALKYNTTGFRNSAFGGRDYDNGASSYGTLNLNTTGSYNSAFGQGALAKNTTASNNTAVGYQAGYANTTGTGNTFVGQLTGLQKTTGDYNTVLGLQAFKVNAGGSNNTIIGVAAGYVSTGSNNTFVGCRATTTNGCGELMTTGSKNTILGGYNGNQGGLDIRTASNNIVLSDGDGVPRMYYHHGSAAWFSPVIRDKTTAAAANMVIDGTGGYMMRSTSSLRYKNTVNNATHGLTELLALRPVTYKGNNDGDTVFGGLIAEEVHDAGLTEFVQYNDDGEPDALAYSNMVSLCIKAIQEQQATITALTDRITALEGA